MRKRIVSLLAIILLVLLPCTNVQASTFNTQNSISARRQQYGYITESNVRLRSEPGLSGTIYGLLQLNEEVGLVNGTRTYADGYYWVYVQVYGRNVGGGWVAEQYVQEYIV